MLCYTALSICHSSKLVGKEPKHRQQQIDSGQCDMRSSSLFWPLVLSVGAPSFALAPPRAAGPRQHHPPTHRPKVGMRVKETSGMRAVRSLVVAVLALVVLAVPVVVLADGRVALVVGNRAPTPTSGGCRTRVCQPGAGRPRGRGSGSGWRFRPGSGVWKPRSAGSATCGPTF